MRQMQDAYHIQGTEGFSCFILMQYTDCRHNWSRTKQSQDNEAPVNVLSVCNFVLSVEHGVSIT